MVNNRSNLTKKITVNKGDLILVIPKTMDSGDTICVTDHTGFMIYFKSDEDYNKHIREFSAYKPKGWIKRLFS